MCLRLCVRWMRLRLRRWWSLKKPGIFMTPLNRIFAARSRKPIPKPEQGLYHFHWNHGRSNSRVHLRLDPDESGLLIVNANQVYHLNPSAAKMAFYMLHNFSQEEAAKALANSFDIPKNILLEDYCHYADSLRDLLDEKVCPICDMDVETSLPFTANLSAPYRMDIALTYRCNNACAHCYNGRSRSFPELTTGDWFKIIDRLWELRIPHIVFTGGEPTLRQDLAELIHHAEENGQITGLNTNGRLLANDNLVRSLLDAGLDHVQITLESHIPEIHNTMVMHEGAWEETVAGIKNVLKTKMFLMTNTTMLTLNQHSIPETVEFLAQLGVPTVGLNALIYSGKGKTVGTGLKDEDLQPLLTAAQEITARHHQKLIWYTPTQYCHFDPVEFNLGIKGCSAALYNMCLEPDGSVLPCQSYYYSVGNLLKDPWEKIWNHDLCVQLRGRKNLPEKCSNCLIRSDCGGGCPLTFETESDSFLQVRRQL